MSSKKELLYVAFLLSDKDPHMITFDGESLEKIVDYYSGEFTIRSFKEYVETNNEEIMKNNFCDLFQDLRSKIDVLIIDWDFLYELWNIDQKKDNIRNYLMGIFCLSFMSAKRSECRECPIHVGKCKDCPIPKECSRRKLDVLTIAKSGQKPIFPEFLNWLRDRELETHEIPICSRKTLKAALSTIEGRFRSPVFAITADAFATKVLQGASK